VTRNRTIGFPLSAAAVTLSTMAIRYGVQADSEEECAEGLARLVDAGMLPVMLPKLLTDNRWMARAVPSPGREPARPNDR
jgi:hypothetical protein